jgi:hypothetical protein
MWVIQKHANVPLASQTVRSSLGLTGLLERLVYERTRTSKLKYLVFARQHAQAPYGPPKRAPYRSKRWIEKTRKQDRIILVLGEQTLMRSRKFLWSQPPTIYQRHPDRNNQREPQRASHYMPQKRRRVWLQPGLRRKTGCQTGAARAV